MAFGTNKLFSTVCLSAALVLSGCSKNDGTVDPASSDIVSESSAANGTSSPKSSSDSASNVPESLPASSSSSPESTPVSIEKPRIGDLMGSEDLPSRGKAFCICTTTDHNADSSVNVINYAVYDEYDNIIALFGEKSYFYAFEYDDDGNITKTYDSLENSSTEFEYKDGHIVKMHFTRRDGQTYAETYEYDDYGTRIKDTHYFIEVDYTSVSTAKPEYDAQGQLIRETCYNSGGGVDLIIEYEYNDKGQVVKETSSSHGAKKVSEYTLDERGNKLSDYAKHVNNADGTVISEVRMEYEYNSDNKVTSEKQFIIKNSTETLERFISYSYEY